MSAREQMQVSAGSWVQRFAGSSEMGALIAAFDWAATPLGPPDEWSVDLRAAVRMCMSTNFPVLVVCGPEMIKLYNDGYRVMLGKEKHPSALGSPAEVVWDEIWDTVGPQFAHVYDTGQPTWSEDQLLVIERNGYPEECYFTYSYSAVVGDDGDVIGVVDIATETTPSIFAHERLSCLTDLTSTLVQVDHVTEVCLQTTAVMARWPSSVPAADVYLEVDEQLILVASNRRGAHPAVDPSIADGRSVASALAAHGPVDVPIPSVTVPVGGSEVGAVGAIVLSLNPRRPFDAGYVQFVELVARAVGAALDRAHRQAIELDEYRRIGDTLQQAMLPPAGDFGHVAARYLPATGNLAVGGDWYDVIELSDDRWALVVGDCVGHGLDAAAAMSQLRAAARAMLMQGSGPAETLEALSVFARSVDDASFATATCAVVDAREATVTYARAGHPYGLTVRDGHVTWLDGIGGPPLGFQETAAYTSAVHRYVPGELLILYSDGLIERRGEEIDVGLARLEREAALCSGMPVERVADDLVTAMLSPVPADDVVLVVKRLPAVGAAPELNGS